MSTRNIEEKNIIRFMVHHAISDLDDLMTKIIEEAGENAKQVFIVTRTPKFRRALPIYLEEQKKHNEKILEIENVMAEKQTHCSLFFQVKLNLVRTKIFFFKF
jgi:hypothetical protein